MMEKTLLPANDWQLGDWLPITFIPSTPDEIEYMDHVRARVEKENDRYIEKLKQQK
jgi:hypothetical protein